MVIYHSSLGKLIINSSILEVSDFPCLTDVPRPCFRRLFSSSGFSLLTQTVKNTPAMWETPCSIPGSETPPAEENGNPLQDSFLEDSMDKEAWQAAVDGVAKVGHD